MSKNASKTEPAKLLVLLLSQKGEAIKAPVKSSRQREVILDFT